MRYTWITCDDCGRQFAQGHRRSHEAGRIHRGAIRRAAAKPTHTRRPSATVRIPARLRSYISGTSWYQGERYGSDDTADLDRMAALVDRGAVERSDVEGLRFLAQQAEFCASANEDMATIDRDPDAINELAAARRFLANIKAIGVTPEGCR